MKKFSVLFMLFIVVTIAFSSASVNITFATHTTIIAWSKEPPADPSYEVHPGAPNEYHWNGYTAKWLNFTVENNGPDAIKEIKLAFRKDLNGNSYFNFTSTRQKEGWSAIPDEFGPNKCPTVIWFRAEDSEYYIKKGEIARFDIFMTEGPKDECSYNIDIWTIDAGYPSETNRHELFVLIDNHLPTVEIICPRNGTVFQEGEIVWINATATDIEGAHPSGIMKIELWFVYIEKGKPPSSPTYVGLMKYDSAKKVYWWKTDAQHLLDEAWHKAVALAYDYAENKKESAPIMFFWYRPGPPGEPVAAYTVDPCFLEKKPVGHVDSTVKVEVTVHTGFLPYTQVLVKFDELVIGNGTTDAFGQIYLNIEFKVPETPRGVYKISASDGKTKISTDFTVIPWMWIDKREGVVGDEVAVTGKGFAKNVDVEVIYRDVSFGKVYWDWALEWIDETAKLEWRPNLDNLTLGKAKTDDGGTFTFKFKIPQSYGGMHPIFGKEVISGVRSGWMPEYPQATSFKVKTKIWTEPAIGLSGQYVRLYGEGLPLPEYIEKLYDCKTKTTTTQEHNWYLVIDFGPNKYWIFEKGTILNNEFDLAWLQKLYFPFAYYTSRSDQTAPLWNGKLYWLDSQNQYHIGSPFLKVPALMPSDYEIALYQFDLKTETDVRKFEATTTFTILKDPLHVRVHSGAIYFPGEKIAVHAEIDVDGSATDPTTILFTLYREETIVTDLTSKRIDTGLYMAAFTCPETAGNYFIKVNVTKAYPGFTLAGFGASGFIVSPTLNGFNAILTGIKDDIATINTNIGAIKLNLSDIGAKLTSVEGSMATIETKIGTVNASLNDIGATILLIDRNTVEIRTVVGDIQGKVTSIQGKNVEIETNLGKTSTTIDSIKMDTDLQTRSVALYTGLALVAAISAIIAAALIWKKLFT
jgi:hypothetical protein